MTQQTEHQGSVHEDWRLGATCSDCQAHYHELRNRHGIAPMASLSRMRDMEYQSVYSAEQEAVADARANGIEPERY